CVGQKVQQHPLLSAGRHIRQCYLHQTYFTSDSVTSIKHTSHQTVLPPSNIELKSNKNRITVRKKYEL
ncbi:hypothetical protein Bpfe_027146, partial [Biomphalaria pfeifferi]